MRVLVVGAKEGSLGHAVASEARAAGHDVTCAGIGGEQTHMDVKKVQQIRATLEEVKPHHLVCTVGVNEPGTIRGKGWLERLLRTQQVNYVGPLILASEFCRYWRDNPDEDVVHHCVAISSNSAHIARSPSGSYCASKAALSMGYRCAAREMSGMPFAIYTYEPGWMSRTPMSNQVMSDLAGQGVQPHRIPGGNEVDPRELARMIVANLAFGRWLNGTSIRLDGGEQ